MTERGLWKLNERNVSIMRGAYSAPLSICQQILFLENMRCGFACAEQPTGCRGYHLYFSGQDWIGAMIYAFAHDYSIFYGFFAVCFAVFAGWLAAAAFANSNLNKSAHEAIFERNKLILLDRRRQKDTQTTCVQY